MGKAENYDRAGIAFINLGSLLAQIVQIAGYPTLLSLALTRADYPSWVVGIIVSLQWIVVLILAPLVPTVLSRFGPRVTCQVGAAISIIAVGFLYASTSLPSIAISSVLMGLGLTIRWVACDTWIVESTPDQLRGRVVGIHETLMGLGIAIGPILTMVSAGNETTALLTLAAILACSVISFAFGAAPDTEMDDPGADQMGRSKISYVFRALVLALLAAVVAGYIETAMVSLLPIHLMNFDYSEAHALMLLSAFGLGGTLLQTPLGWVADQWSFRAGQVLCSALIITSGILIIFAVNSPALIMVALFFWGGCVGGLNTLAVIEAGATLRAGLSGTGMALIASCYTLGGVVGPIVSGATLSSMGGHGAIVVIVALTALYGTTLARKR
ncbi:MFS transporter [uncultured Agrobacterium sp.]|uniref:MFS transporter n=1 Tax=uncultured Agrobacterium sp. TaxID=157277 RepID=UPI0025E5B4C6|nr:MFS transporter [uncultured Agrobacterium sp.]